MQHPDEIKRRLADYLDAPLARLSVLASGWETTVFEFVLESASPRCPSIPTQAPVVLRFYQGAAGEAKAVRESATVDRLFACGYPVPRPFAFERSDRALGAPFFVMERLAGGPMLTVRSFPEAFKTFSLPFFSFVRAQARLHKLDVAGSGLREIPRAFTSGALGETASSSDDSPLLDRVLATIAARVAEGPLPGLRDALISVTERAQQFRDAPPSIVHMDYHPLNTMVQGVRVTGVIDWANADVGDRHLDAAMTAVILSSWALEKPRWMRDNLVGNTLRASFAAMYVPLYHAMAPMDLRRFRYCQTVSALLRLSLYGMMRARGPQSVGFRAEALTEITPPAVRALSRYATRKAGTQVRLDAAAPQPA
ncbi:MAG TPA: phosphotransferase [Candidatus Acidoferrales bacterium]|nr:phosphotransferase [Candidatus Acidoferrales bacterium]